METQRAPTCIYLVLQVATSCPTATDRGSSPYHHLPSQCEAYPKIPRPIGCFLLVHVGISGITLEFLLIVPTYMLFWSWDFAFWQAVLSVSSRMVWGAKAYPSAWSSQQSGCGCRASWSSSLHRSPLCRWQGLCMGTLVASLDGSIAFGYVPKCLWPSTLLSGSPSRTSSHPNMRGLVQQPCKMRGLRLALYLLSVFFLFTLKLYLLISLAIIKILYIIYLQIQVYMHFNVCTFIYIYHYMLYIHKYIHMKCMYQQHLYLCIFQHSCIGNLYTEKNYKCIFFSILASCGPNEQPITQWWPCQKWQLPPIKQELKQHCSQTLCLVKGDLLPWHPSGIRLVLTDSHWVTWEHVGYDSVAKRHQPFTKQHGNTWLTTS